MKARLQMLISTEKAALRNRNRFIENYNCALDKWIPSQNEFPHTRETRLYERYEAIRRRINAEINNLLHQNLIQQYN